MDFVQNALLKILSIEYPRRCGKLCDILCKPNGIFLISNLHMIEYLANNHTRYLRILRLLSHFPTICVM